MNEIPPVKPPIEAGETFWSPGGDVELIVLAREYRHGTWVLTVKEVE